MLTHGEGDVLRMHDRWPTTVALWLQILHRGKPAVSKVIVIHRSDVRSPELQAEYDHVEPKQEPSTNIDQIVDLAAFSDYMQYRACDVANFVAKELGVCLYRLEDRVLFTNTHAQTLFRISPNTSPLEKAWTVVAKALALDYVGFLLSDSAESRGLPAEQTAPFSYQQTLNSQPLFLKYMNRMIMTILQSDSPERFVIKDLLNGEEWLIDL
jgi:hypothetical protein